jgi:hypothetical protein
MPRSERFRASVAAKRVAGSYVHNSPELMLVSTRDLVGVLIELPHSDHRDEVLASMRPAHVFANLSGRHLSIG